MKNHVSKIKQLRDQKGLTQRQVAIACDVDVSTVRNWERGRDRVFRKVAELCTLLGCQVQDLFEE